MTSDTSPAPMTDEDIERAYAELRQRKANEAAATRAAELAPVKALVETEAFATVLDQITQLRAGLGVSSDLFTHAHAAVLGMTGLRSAGALPAPLAGQ